jgi:hypothetical protein
LKPTSATWRLGRPFAISGDTVIVGLSGSGSDGAAAVFVRTGSTWAEHAILQPAAAQQSGSYLSIAAVATSGTRVAVWWQRTVLCTPVMIICNTDPKPETIAIFSRTGATWTREAAIDTPTIDLYGFAAASGRWGRSPLAMSDEALLVGAPGLSTGQSGRVYVYHRAGALWNLAATLAGIYPSQNDQFGGAVAFDGVTAIVSAANTYGPTVDVKFGFEPGGVYIFRKSGAAWAQEAYLVDPQEVHFGSQVDISGDRAVVAGVGVYVYERGAGQWPTRSTLMSPNEWVPNPSVRGVSIDGGIALVHRLNGQQLDGTTQVFARGTTAWAGAGTTNVRAFGDGQFSGSTLIGYAATDTKFQAFTLDVASIPSPPQLSVSHPSLYFGLRSTVLTPPQTEAVTVTNARGAAVSWTVSTNQSWLTTVGSATGSGTFTVSVKPGTYGVGTLHGQVTVAAAGASSQTIDVTFTTYASTTAPWGAIDSPVAGVTGVIGSMPMTGWALHQVGIEKVAIFREAVGAEGAPSTLVFIGDAVMVEGARPDVEASAGQPFNYSAGWGLMILTNMLPNQGNGTFTLHAFAYGLDGTVTELGERTITCTNAAATVPFGAIDTPAQGATIAGAQYVNWGWALAPHPQRIPEDGSTISVYVDGASIGHPTAHGITRGDIAGLFPGLSNSTSAIGYKMIDTTALANGVHTIAWVVADMAGNASGIGSRYFTVQNNGTAALRTAPQLTLSSSSGLTDNLWTSAVSVRRGYGKDAVDEDVPPAGDAARMIASTELDRLEIRLADGGGGSFEGGLRVGTEIRPLPIGSQLDRRTGVFLWQPGVGFFGQYDFVFLRHTAAGTERLLLAVVLGPKNSGASNVAFAIDTAPGLTDGPFVVGGWAFDRGARTGTGIDAVHVWAYPADGGKPSFLGSATLGGDRLDVATAFGAAARLSGYGLIVNGLASGTYDIAVFPHSAVTNRFVAAKIVRVTIAPSPRSRP